MMKSKNKMTTNSINNYHHHQSSQYLQRKKRRNVAMRKSRGEVEAKGEMQEEEGFGVKEMEKIGLRVEVVVRSLEGRAGREKGGRRWGKYLERLETFAEMLIDWSAESETLVQSKQKVLERKLLRKCNSISNSEGQPIHFSVNNPQLKLSTKDRDCLHLEEIRNKLNDIIRLKQTLLPLFARSRSMLEALLRDLEDLAGNGVGRRENLGRGLESLAQMGVGQGLGVLEQEIRGVLKNSFLKHLLNDSVGIFDSARKDRSTQNDQAKSLQNEIPSKISENDHSKLQKPNIPLSRQMTSKTQKKIPDFNLPDQQGPYLERNNENTASIASATKAIPQPSPDLKIFNPGRPDKKSSLQNEDTPPLIPKQSPPSIILSKRSGPLNALELGGLKEILKKSKLGFHKFLKSFGWTDHQIEDVMRTISLRESMKLRVHGGKPAKPRNSPNIYEPKPIYPEASLQFRKIRNPPSQREVKETKETKSIAKDLTKLDHVSNRVPERRLVNLKSHLEERGDPSHARTGLNRSNRAHYKQRRTWAGPDVYQNQDVENHERVNQKTKSLNKAAKFGVGNSRNHKNQLYNRTSPEPSMLSSGNGAETLLNLDGNKSKGPNPKYRPNASKKSGLQISAVREQKVFIKRKREKDIGVEGYATDGFKRLGRGADSDTKDFENIYSDSVKGGFEDTKGSRFRKKSKPEEMGENGSLSKTACKLIRNQKITLNLQIKEYVSDEDKNISGHIANDHFHSQKTHGANFSDDSLHLPGPDTSSIRPTEDSKLDLKKMSVSNNLSQIFRERRSEVNLYAELSIHQRDLSRLSHKSANSVRNEIIPLLPVSDPEFSSQKLKKNRKMRDFLERANQNLSSKSILSLTDNRELFSRRSSSLQDLRVGRRKQPNNTLCGLPNPVKLRMLQRRPFSPPKAFKFADVLEEKNVLNLDLLEYPDLSGHRINSMHSSKQSKDGLVHRQKLLNTRMVSFTSKARGSRSPSGSPGRMLTQPSRSDHEIVQQLRRVSVGSKTSKQMNIQQLKLQIQPLLAQKERGRQQHDHFERSLNYKSRRGNYQNLSCNNAESGLKTGDFPDKEMAVAGTGGQRYRKNESNQVINQDYGSNQSGNIHSDTIQERLSLPNKDETSVRRTSIPGDKRGPTRNQDKGRAQRDSTQKTHSSKLDVFEEICQGLESHLLMGLLEERNKMLRQKSLESSMKKKQCAKLQVRYQRLAQNFDHRVHEFLRDRRFTVQVYPDQIEAFFNGFTEFLCARRLEEVVLNINKEYGPHEGEILKECRKPEGVDVSTFRECQHQPVLSDDSFFEFFYFRHSLNLLGDHPLRELKHPVSRGIKLPSSRQHIRQSENPYHLQAIPSIENFESNNRSEMNSDLILSSENVRTVENFYKSLLKGGEEIAPRENWGLVLEWLRFKPGKPPQIPKTRMGTGDKGTEQANPQHNPLVNGKSQTTVRPSYQADPHQSQTKHDLMTHKTHSHSRAMSIGDKPAWTEFLRSLGPLHCSSDSFSEAAQFQLENLHYTFLAEKMLFDSLNEALCSWRPFATKGRPLPGLSHFGRLNKVRIQPEEIPYIFSVTVSKQMESAALLCGVLGEREALLHQRWSFSTLAPPQRRLLECLLASDENSNGNLLSAAELLNKLREEKLVKFLNWGIFETDEKWLFYDYETLETQLHLNDLVVQALFEDLVVDFLN